MNPTTESNPNIFHGNDKIKEYIRSSCKGEGISGNPQRNYALTKITNPNPLLYYLYDVWYKIQPVWYEIIPFYGISYHFSMKLNEWYDCILWYETQKVWYQIVLLLLLFILRYET